jgi:subtilisin family serine protease
VVAVLDSGVGEHPWLGRDHVLHDPHVLGEPIGIPSLAHEVEQRPDVDDTEQLVGELGPDAGHGTFIAGLVRQTCPEARILSIRLFRDSGVVDEASLLRALQLLALHQLRAIAGDPECPLVDVVSLSLGYYHEQPDDPAFDPLLAGPIALLGRLGVAVVVSAGNDATDRPSYPAAFAGLSAPGAVPVCAVGALNPDGTIALFSNDGPWVRYLRPGAALVSTLPTTMDGSMEATNRLVDERGEERSAIDPDGFQSGFAVWSGTSFAAPVFAGQLAARLRDRFAGGDTDADPRRTVARVSEVLAGMPGRGGG